MDESIEQEYEKEQKISTDHVSRALTFFSVLKAIIDGRD